MLVAETDLAALKFLTLSLHFAKKKESGEQARRGRPSGQKQVIPVGPEATGAQLQPSSVVLLSRAFSHACQGRKGACFFPHCTEQLSSVCMTS